jgi:cyclic beta-1,2-glucan synthetase
MDIMLNGWLLSDDRLSHLGPFRLLSVEWSFGFRDQPGRYGACCDPPTLSREHLIRAAGRQFVEGDV